MRQQSQRKEPWWKSKARQRIALLIAGALLGASCVLLPAVAQPACVAVVKVLHLAGIP
mgnify:CR=1 FL=1